MTSAASGDCCWIGDSCPIHNPPHFDRCESCNGSGMVAGYTCEECHGRGWLRAGSRLYHEEFIAGAEAGAYD